MRQQQDLELKPSTARYISDSEILDRLIAEVVALLNRQPDWQADYAGYIEGANCWQVLVCKQGEDGEDADIIGSLLFEKLGSPEDYEFCDPNQNSEYLGFYDAFWWRPDEDLEDELYKLDLVNDLERLAYPLELERLQCNFEKAKAKYKKGERVRVLLAGNWHAGYMVHGFAPDTYSVRCRGADNPDSGCAVVLPESVKLESEFLEPNPFAANDDWLGEVDNKDRDPFEGKTSEGFGLFSTA